MIAGRLNKRIVVEHSTASEENITGEEVRTGTEFLTLRANVIWGAGRRETPNLEVVYSYDITFIVWLHWLGKIKEGDTVTYAGKKFLIESIEPVPEQKMMYIKGGTLS